MNWIHIKRNLGNLLQNNNKSAIKLRAERWAKLLNKQERPENRARKASIESLSAA